MATPKENIDGYMGSGWFDEWQVMGKDAAVEERRFLAYKGRLNLSIISDLYDRIRNDLDILNSVKKDYERGMNILAQGRRLNRDQIGTIHDLFTIAQLVVETENDMLEAMWAVGLASAFVVFPFALLEARANELAKVLPELEKQLHEAEKEAQNAKIKTGVHAVITVFELLVPEVSLLGRAGIYLGEVVVNKALGPSTPNTFQRYEGDVTPGVKQFSEAVHHVEEYSHTAHDVAKSTGKAATAATFYFDYREITESSERAEKVKEALEKVKDAYDKLQRLIIENKPKLEQFFIVFERWVQAIDDIRKTAANGRSARVKDMMAARYDPAEDIYVDSNTLEIETKRNAYFGRGRSISAPVQSQLILTSPSLRRAFR